MNQVSELNVIVPVYNEEQSIGAVIEQWTGVLAGLKIDYQMHLYNDGSRDGTAGRIKELAAGNPGIIVHEKANSGHGPTILLGYGENGNSEWLLQIDADGEMPAQSFPDLWRQRQSYDILIGKRVGRKSNISRRLVSLVSRLVIRILFGPGIWDVNSPYRLMRTEKFRNIFAAIPPGTFAPNLLVSGMACRQKLRIFERPVPHTQRVYGQASIKRWKLLKAGFLALGQSIIFALKE